MIELGELEAAHQQFERRNLRVVAASLDDQETSKLTQADFPHLVIVSDADRSLANAMDVIHAGSNPDGGDAAAPTTFLIDGDGTIRWTFRADRFFTRLSPAEVIEAAERYLGGNKE